jgi:uncharacterized membrane protein
VLSGAWLGHALHPIMTDIPIGAWTSSVLLDWTGGKDSWSASDRLVLAGVLAAGATVATGWSDWADAEPGNAAVRRSGLVHAAANATATALMIGSYVARRRGARGRGRLLSLAGSAALGAGGWLGGHLSYTLGAGVTAGAPAAGMPATATTGVSLTAGGGHPGLLLRLGRLREQQRRCHGRRGDKRAVASSPNVSRWPTWHSL